MYDLLVFNARIFTLDQEAAIEKGYLAVKGGLIESVATGHPPAGEAKVLIDAAGLIVMPGLTDCHTHLLEYATSELHKTQGSAQKMAGIANLLTALKAGITTLGEHHLGHPVLTQTIKEYKDISLNIPIDVRTAFGCCFIGTDPLTLVSSTRPGEVLTKQDLSRVHWHIMAEVSEHPGENIFLNATVANLPLSAAPRAGEITFTVEELREIVKIFHCHGKKVGAHLEGDKAAQMFIEAGGDVIHHGHGMSAGLAESMAAKGVSLVVTPHAGTSIRPTSPQEVYGFYKNGVKVALASDSYIPVHPAATWIDLPAGSLAGPEEFLKIVHPVLKYFIAQGVPVQEALKLITVNGREIMNLEANGSGTLKPGEPADFIICSKIPGLETTDTGSIKWVVKKGEIVVSRL